MITTIHTLLDEFRQAAISSRDMGDKFERLLHAQRGVHRVAGEHGLLHDGMVAADDEAAVFRIADDNLAGLAAVMKKRGFAIAHKIISQVQKLRVARG